MTAQEAPSDDTLSLKASFEADFTKAKDLLRRVPLIDGHNDFPYMLRGWYGANISAEAFDAHNLPIGQTDLSRLGKGGLGGQFWSAFVPCPKDGSPEKSLAVLRDTLQQLDLIHGLVEQNPRRLAFANDSTSVWQAFRSGRLASLIGVEGLHQIGSCFSALRLFHRLGVRYITLCHDCHNEFADSSKPEAPLHGGLSARGVLAVREMNLTGIIVDLSHSSFETQRHALQVTKAPVIFSHSSCYALQPHARNVPDDILQSLKINGGVIMICFLPSLAGICKDGTQVPASIETVAEHIVHVGETIGYEHVGIGSDFDGMLEGPAGLDDVSAYPSLVAELIGRGLGEKTLEAVLGLNILRVLDAVAQHAANAEHDGEGRVCDAIGPVWTDAQRQILIDKGAERRSRAHHAPVDK